MERKKNALYFGPGEEDKFFRAISLVGRLRGVPREENDDTIEHEKAHIGAIRDLGHADSIRGYSIKIGEKLRRYMKVAVTFDETGIPKEDVIQICMAPRNPSKTDYSLAAMF
jgi:hypothetical protein